MKQGQLASKALLNLPTLLPAQKILLVIHLQHANVAAINVLKSTVSKSQNAFYIYIS